MMKRDERLVELVVKVFTGVDGERLRGRLIGRTDCRGKVELLAEEGLLSMEGLAAAGEAGDGLKRNVRGRVNGLDYAVIAAALEAARDQAAPADEGELEEEADFKATLERLGGAVSSTRVALGQSSEAAAGAAQQRRDVQRKEHSGAADGEIEDPAAPAALSSGAGPPPAYELSRAIDAERRPQGDAPAPPGRGVRGYSEHAGPSPDEVCDDLARQMRWDASVVIDIIRSLGEGGQVWFPLMWRARTGRAATALAEVLTVDGAPSIVAATAAGLVGITLLDLTIIVHELAKAEGRGVETARSGEERGFTQDREFANTFGQASMRRSPPLGERGRSYGSPDVRAARARYVSRQQLVASVPPGAGELAEASAVYGRVGQSNLIRAGAFEISRGGLSLLPVPTVTRDDLHDIVTDIRRRAEVLDVRGATAGLEAQRVARAGAQLLAGAASKALSGAFEGQPWEVLPEVLLSVLTTLSSGTIDVKENSAIKSASVVADDVGDDDDELRGVLASLDSYRRKGLKLRVTEDWSRGEMSTASSAASSPGDSAVVFEDAPNLDAIHLAVEAVWLGLVAHLPALALRMKVCLDELFACAMRIDSFLRGSGQSPAHRAFALELFLQATRVLGGPGGRVSALGDEPQLPRFWSDAAMRKPEQFGRSLVAQMPLFFRAPGVTDDAANGRVILDFKEALSAPAYQKAYEPSLQGHAGLAVRAGASAWRAGAVQSTLSTKGHAAELSAAKADTKRARAATQARLQEKTALEVKLRKANVTLVNLRASQAGSRRG